MAIYIPSVKRRVARNSLVSFDLIQDLDPSLPDEEQMLDRIYNTLMLGKASMRTFRGRFERLDHEIEKIIDSFAPSKKVIRMHDVAASNAVTSMELFEKVSNIRDRDIHITASDVCTKIDVHPLSADWRLISYSDFKYHTGWIQAVGRKVVVNSNLPLKKVDNNKFVFALNKLMAVYVDLFVIRGFGRKKSSAEKKTISLFHPHAIDLASRDARFKLQQYDLLNPSPEKYDVVRAMTVLGRFRGHDFQTAVETLANSVAEDGYLIVGFGKKESSIFTKRGGRMRHYKDLVAPYSLKNEMERIYLRG